MNQDTHTEQSSGKTDTVFTELFVRNYLAYLAGYVHDLNLKAGWWTDLATGADLRVNYATLMADRKAKPLRNIGELLCLVHSEVSEAMEGDRKRLMDDKLPHRPMLEVELADALIRILDMAGGLQLDLAGAMVEKLAYNSRRADHRPENRAAAGGKSF